MRVLPQVLDGKKQVQSQITAVRLQGGAAGHKRGPGVRLQRGGRGQA